MGQLPKGAITLIETPNDASIYSPPEEQEIAYITQTTLSVDDTQTIIDILKKRFPKLIEPSKQDICYATTNRQQAVKAIATDCDALIVIGAPNSSNSRRLVEVAEQNGCKEARLIGCANEIDWEWLQTAKTLGISAGASAPEILVEEVVEACKEKFNVELEEVEIARETVHFKLPKQLVV